MAPLQNRQDPIALKRQAAELIRAALPDYLVSLFDELLPAGMNERSLSASMDDPGRFLSNGLEREVELAKAATPKQETCELLTVDQAAELTKVHPSTIYRMIRSGELRRVRFGRLVRVDRVDLEELITRSKEGSR